MHDGIKSELGRARYMSLRLKRGIVQAISYRRQFVDIVLTCGVEQRESVLVTQRPRGSFVCTSANR